MALHTSSAADAALQTNCAETEKSIQASIQPSSTDNPFSDFVNPVHARLLKALALNWRFVSSNGLRLEDAQGRTCLDFTAGYGALAFGHHPPEIWRAMEEFHIGERPVLSQPSDRWLVGEFARDLAETCMWMLSEEYVGTASLLQVKLIEASAGSNERIRNRVCRRSGSDIALDN